MGCCGRGKQKQQQQQPQQKPQQKQQQHPQIPRDLVVLNWIRHYSHQRPWYTFPLHPIAVPFYRGLYWIARKWYLWIRVRVWHPGEQYEQFISSLELD